MPYVGRFAPSPTGDLHLGTAAAAAAAFLHARQCGGEWIVRIEDIDPPREVPGSAAAILRALEALDLHWDRPVDYQSRHVDDHLAAAARLVDAGEAYYCTCSRRTIRALTGGARYPGTCREREKGPDDAAIRLRVGHAPIEFTDRLAGRQQTDLESTVGDFVIVRRDGLPAYHLAVVVDDASGAITDIVRGRDLLDSTPLHIHCQRRLGLSTPDYWHIPVVTDAAGDKLSKSSGAAAVDVTQGSAVAWRVLTLLGCQPPAELSGAAPRELWHWAVGHWRIDKLAGRDFVPACE